MSKIPDAWDDDWVATADTTANHIQPQTPSQPKVLSRAERKTQHQEANRKLWDKADNPDRFHFLESRSNEVPLKSEFKPQVKVLSRKPNASLTGGVAGLGIQDDEDSEEERRRSAAATLAERQRKAAAEREEKQRRYAEARERIMGPGSAPSQGCAVAEGAKSTSSSRQSSRKGRGAIPKGRSETGSPSEASPAPNATPQPQQQHTKQLFDPGYLAKPSDARPAVRSATPRADQQPVRMPRGPDNSGRGGFTTRGGRGA